MALPPDYHIHTLLCHHASGEASDYAGQAVKLGLAEIGFSEHNPMPREDYDNWHVFERDLDAYVEQVHKARRDHPGLQIKLGLEMDFIPGMEDWLKDLAARHPWDYLIGAVHYISPTWALDNPEMISEWQRRDPLEVWTTYFERLAEAADSGLFDIVAHPDLCKKFRFYPATDHAPLYQRFLSAMQKGGLALELNTAGLRKDCREIYPALPMVEQAAQLGIPITFGSDAHAPAEVAMNFAEAVQLARRAGYTHSCRFTRRRREITRF